MGEAAEKTTGRGRIRRLLRRDPVLIAAILVVTIAFSRYFLTASGAELTFFHEDDTGYYSRISEELARGHPFTFDGINPTNGFHPLWVLVLAPIHWVIPEPEAFTRAAFVLQYLLFLAVVAFVFLLARLATGGRLLIPLAAALYVGVERYFYKVIITGLETSLFVSLALFILWLLASGRLERAWAQRPERVGGLLGLLFLARLEAGLFLAAALAVPLGWPLVRSRAWSRLGRFVVGGAALPATYLSLTLYFVGTVVPVSGSMKRMGAAHRCNATAQGIADALSVPSLYNYEVSTLRDVAFARLGAPFRRLAAAFGSPTEQYGISAALTYFSAAAALAVLGLYVWRRWRRRSVDAPGLVYLDGTVAAAVLVVGFNKAIVHCDALAYYYPALFSIAQVLAGAYVLGSFEQRFASYGGIALAVGFTALVLRAGVAAHPALARELASGRGYANLYAAANFARDRLPPDAVIASYNAGIIGFFSRRTVINMDGRVNSPRYLTEVVAADVLGNVEVSRRTAKFWKEEGVQYFADFMECAKPYSEFQDTMGFEALFESAPVDGWCGRVYRVTYR